MNFPLDAFGVIFAAFVIGLALGFCSFLFSRYMHADDIPTSSSNASTVFLLVFIVIIAIKY